MSYFRPARQETWLRLLVQSQLVCIYLVKRDQEEWVLLCRISPPAILPSFLPYCGRISILFPINPLPSVVSPCHYILEGHLPHQIFSYVMSEKPMLPAELSLFCWWKLVPISFFPHANTLCWLECMYAYFFFKKRNIISHTKNTEIIWKRFCCFCPPTCLLLEFGS